MPRYRLTIEYDGTPFVGWQLQKNGPSVQEHLANAVQAFCGKRFVPRGAGRTDSGVHALAQVAHLDLPKAYDPGTIANALNHLLRPAPIAILEVREVDDAFDARFSATARHYLYKIVNRRPAPTIGRDYVWWVSRPLDEKAMDKAAKLLLGTHDFTTFRNVDCQAKSPVKTLDQLDVKRMGDNICIEASARSFLHSQVRSLAGSLKLIGEGRWSEADLLAALAARKRSACGPVAPAKGLYFAKVDYADDIES